MITFPQCEILKKLQRAKYQWKRLKFQFSRSNFLKSYCSIKETVSSGLWLLFGMVHLTEISRGTADGLNNFRCSNNLTLTINILMRLMRFMTMPSSRINTRFCNSFMCFIFILQRKINNYKLGQKYIHIYIQKWLSLLLLGHLLKGTVSRDWDWL